MVPPDSARIETENGQPMLARPARVHFSTRYPLARGTECAMNLTSASAWRRPADGVSVYATAMPADATSTHATATGNRQRYHRRDLREGFR